MRELPKALFVAPTESDAHSLIARLENPRFYKQRIGAVHGGIWSGASTKILITGHNPDATAGALREAVELDKPLAIISFGFGSALSPNLNIGDCVIGAQFIDAIGPQSRFKQITIDEGTNATISQILRNSPEIRGRLGTIATVFDPVFNPIEKAGLFERTRCDVVDQSAIAVANIAEEVKIPSVVVRCIFDMSDEALPEEALMVRENRKISTTRILGRIAIRPSRIFSMRDMNARARLCRSRLDIFIDKFWESLKYKREDAIAVARRSG
jgi:nucleoside phosphorylase